MIEMLKELQRRFEHEIKTNNAFFWYIVATGAVNVVIFVWLMGVIFG
ncbi:hypothetical protein CcrColossus_gp315 [Caulobacter phage CcrColossus]|uniref:Uncharacterized protein n=1 Tax=Caulobacter phage CcrColossus TaxID=1211640 RepID=K4JUZ8_9CAUD|nr:hypothetical protein CcrColossus_gp315 [Caulobacter phage CcrColossus]AFU88185.1 hypothetical protein CcrColossus_gp315 [Caulobacter phage CcrColossus]